MVIVKHSITWRFSSADVEVNQSMSPHDLTVWFEPHVGFFLCCLSKSRNVLYLPNKGLRYGIYVPRYINTPRGCLVGQYRSIKDYFVCEYFSSLRDEGYFTWALFGLLILVGRMLLKHLQVDEEKCNKTLHLNINKGVVDPRDWLVQSDVSNRLIYIYVCISCVIIYAIKIRL